MSLLKQTKVSTRRDPGVKIATARVADSFSFFCLATAAVSDGVALAIGYLMAPHDWHKGVCVSSLASQNEQFGIDLTLIEDLQAI